MGLIRGLALRYVGRAALLVIIVTGIAPADADAPPAVVVRGPVPHALGSSRAPVVIVEFSDYQCPYCRRYYATAFPRVKADYVDTGKVRYVVRDLPLDMHARAFAAAEAARCAGASGKFWAMRKALFEEQETLSPARLAALARGVGAPVEEFQACLADHRFAGAVRRDVKDAAAAGLDATPSFVIGTAGPAGITGTAMVGAQPYSSFAEKIEQLLRAPSRPAPKARSPLPAPSPLI